VIAPLGGRRLPVVWRVPIVRALLVALPALFTATLLFFNTPWWTKTLVGGIAVLAIASPEAALLAVAIAAPLGRALTTYLEPTSLLQLTEAMVVAWIAGALMRTPARVRGPRVAASIGWLLALVVAASVAIQLAHLAHFPGEPRATLDEVYHAYYIIPNRIGLREAARLLEGIALAALVVTFVRTKPSLADTLPAALCASGTVAALINLDQWRRIGAVQWRISAAVTDVNAAGSFFVMLLLLAIGMMLRARRWSRAPWMAASAMMFAALWLTQSRTAFAAGSVAAAILVGWFISMRLPPGARRVLIPSLAALAIGVVAYRVHEFSFGVDYRRQFLGTSLRMIAARPLLGVGIGQYYRISALFLSPQLAWFYGHENAHNNFLQMAAELGLVGFTLFVSWIGLGFARAFAAIEIDRRDTRLVGAVAGAAAFVATWIASHPLLVPEVAFPFWLLFGLIWALAGSTLLNARAEPEVDAAMPPSRSWLATWGAAAAIAAACAVNGWRGPVTPPASADVDGFYGWETDASGVRYRWGDAYASVFVPADVNRVYIPVRFPVEPRILRPVRVEAMVAGQPRTEATVSTEWAILNVALPDVSPPDEFKRIDLKVERTFVPALYIPGSADRRTVGVQVGECRLFREH
jgi:O-antigen ligase